MREVSGGDVLFSLVIVSVVMGLVAGLSYVVLNALTDSGRVLGVDPLYIVLISAALTCSLLVVRAYPGPKSDFGPVWQWVALILAVPVASLVLRIPFGLSHDSVSWVVAWWMTQISVLSFVAVLSMYLHARDSTISAEAAKTTDF